MSVVRHRCRIRGLLPHGFMVVLLAASGLSAGVVAASDDLILDEASPLSAPQALPLAGNLPALVIMATIGRSCGARRAFSARFQPPRLQP